AQSLVGQQGPGQQARLAEDLEAVADAENRTTIGREASDGLHRRREPRDRPCAEIVAIGEASGYDHTVQLREIRLLVPDQSALADPPHRRQGVALVAGPRELDDADHFSSSTSKSSTSG